MFSQLPCVGVVLGRKVELDAPEDSSCCGRLERFVQPRGLVGAEIVKDDSDDPQRRWLHDSPTSRGNTWPLSTLSTTTYYDTKLNRRPPAQADIQQFFGVTPPSVHNMIVSLERKGLLARTPDKPRSIHVLAAPCAMPRLDSSRLTGPTRPCPAN